MEGLKGILMNFKYLNIYLAYLSNTCVLATMLGISVKNLM